MSKDDQQKLIGQVKKKLLSLVKQPRFSVWGRVVLYSLLTLAVASTIYFVFFKAASAGAAWFDESWLYRKEVTVTNSGSAQTDFQVQIGLDTATLITAGKMQSDCDDIRLTDNNGKILPHWVETGTNACNTATTAIWTKVPNVYAGTNATTVYVYYGNPSAINVENGNQVFIIFDNFSSSGLGSYWLQDTSSFSVGSGQLSHTGGVGSNNLYRSTGLAALTDWRIVGRNKVSSGNHDAYVGVNNTASALRSAGNGVGIRVSGGSSGVWEWGKWVSGSETQLGLGSNGSAATATYHLLELKKGGTTFTFYVNGSQVDQETITEFDYTYFQIEGYDQGFWDFVFLTKNTTTPPSAGTPGTEAQGPGPVAWWKFDEGYGTTANNSTLKTGINGTISGATWQTEDQCISGKCLYFDGTNDKVSVSSFNNAIDFTGAHSFSTWFKYTGFMTGNNGGKGGLFTTTAGPRVYTNDNSTNALCYQSSSSVCTGSLNNNQWYFYSYTYDGSTVYIYLNGVQITSGTPGEAAASTLDIGFSQWWHKGMIDEMKFYNYQRTAEQVRGDYLAGLARQSSGKGLSAAFGSSPARQGALSDGLVGYWKMDEASWTNDCSTTSVTDSSGNGNNGKACPASTGPTGGAAGKFGNAGDFDGSEDYLLTTSLPTTVVDNFTLAVWVNPDTLSGTDFILHNGANGSNGYGIWSDAGNLSVRLWDGVTNNFDSGGDLSTGSWQQIVVVRNNGITRVYLNGSQTSTTSTITPITPDTRFVIGAPQSSAEFFDGKIDDVRIYNRALSPKEVRDLYSFAPGPVGYWSFDENTGSSVQDRSGNGSTGTWSGTGAIHWASGKFGPAGKFNGSDDYVNGSITLGTGKPFTISAWSNISNLSAHRIAFSLNGVISFGYNSDFNAFRLVASEGGSYPGVSAGVPSTNTWEHYAGIYDGSNFYIYKNGVLQASTAITLTSSLTTYAIGKCHDCWYGSTFMNGQIDDVRVYNYARTPKQIIEDMNAGHPAVGSPVGSAAGHWRFDEGQGITANNSGSVGSAINGTLTNMASPATSTSGWSQSGRFGKALSFDGINDQVLVSDNAALDPSVQMTLSAWINMSTLPSSAGRVFDIVDKWNGTANQRSYEWWIDTSNKVDFIATSDGTTGTQATLVGNTALSASAWYQLAITYDGSSYKMYINGAQDKSGTGPTSIFNSTTNFSIGRDDSTNASMFAGTIDEVKIYSYALTEDEVRLDYNQGSAIKMGALGNNSSYEKDAANQEYCVPGDTTSCAAPVAEWTFDEGTGTSVYDHSGNANTGTWNGTGAVHWLAGKIGPAGKFNGTDDYVDVGDPANGSLDFGTGNFSVFAWVKSSNQGTSQYIASKGSSWNTYVMYKQSTGKFRAQIKGNSVELNIGETIIADNSWHHVGMTIDRAGLLQTYVDGVPRDSTSMSSISGDTLSNADSFIIGGTSTKYNGQIDQVRVYNYARTPAQVAWDYNRGAPIGLWRLDECQGSTAYDTSGNANNGTITIGGSGTQTAVGTCTTSGTAWYNGATGKRNASLNFDGTDDYVDMGDPSSGIFDFGTNNFTTSAWFKISGGAGTFRWILGKYGMGNTKAHNLYVDTANKITFGLESGSAETLASTTASYTDSNWHFATAVRSGDNMYLYVDGVLSGQNSGVSTYDITNAIPLYVGARYGSGTASLLFNGQIDDVRIFNYALTATQVRNLYNEGTVRFGPATGSP